MPKTTLEVALLDLRSAANVGNILRTAHAFDFSHLYTIGTTPPVTHPAVSKAALLGQQLPSTAFINLAAFLRHLKNRQLIAIETGGIPLEEWLHQERQPTATGYITVLLGHERFGLPPAALAAASAVLTIPHNFIAQGSLNVANAFAITAYLMRSCYT